MTQEKTILTGKEIADIAVEAILEKKGEDIVLLNPGNESGIAEWFLVCQGTNTIHNRAIADAVVIALKEKKAAAWHKEGVDESRWILLDYSDIVINILLPDVREYYNLEDLWKDCPKTKISE